MLRELVANNIFVFSSEYYAQVTASAVITSAGAVVFDTLPFPLESRQVAQFVEERQAVPVKYVINSHYHADHTYGTCFFPKALVVGHRLCREHLDGPGRDGLENVKRSSRELSSIDLILPDIVFDEGEISILLGGVSLRLWHTPGHSPDSIVCLVENEGILLAADTMMPVPFFADGSWQDFINSLEALRDVPIESIVQGHGEVILRGEVPVRIDNDLAYLYALREKVEALVDRNLGPESVDTIDIEDCGKSRIALNGLVQQLHRTNAEVLYWEVRREREGEPG
ncbi:MAG: MBL fold metallo-hydrolase [Anaerolineae bacterium]|nr:MBL fold metallo-hydrolase [Anaerolineae bacterium]